LRHQRYADVMSGGLDDDTYYVANDDGEM